MVKHKHSLQQNLKQKGKRWRRQRRIQPKESCSVMNTQDQQQQQKEQENQVLRQINNLSLGLSERSAKLDHLDSLFSINEQQWLIHDKQISELYEFDRQSRTIRDKTNEALDFVIHGCCRLQQEIKKQQQPHFGQHKHREHGNRIMHEFLLGQENITRNSMHEKTNEILRKDRMRLYQHSVRCPIAMQIFLDANPQYWRFVPMSAEESERSEQQQIQANNLHTNETDASYRTRDECSLYVQSVPKPPIGFTFSNRQIFLQTKYFQQKRDLHLPNQDIDLYNASIAAVLPETCSDMFRTLIESLFITYAQTSLNTIGNVLNEEQRNLYYPLNNPWSLRGDEWCQNLLRRPQPQKIT